MLIAPDVSGPVSFVYEVEWKEDGELEVYPFVSPTPHTQMNTRLTPTRMVTDEINNETSHDQPARGGV